MVQVVSTRVSSFPWENSVFVVWGWLFDHLDPLNYDVIGDQFSLGSYNHHIRELEVEFLILLADVINRL